MSSMLVPEALNQCWFRLGHSLRRLTNVKPALLLVSARMGFYLYIYFSTVALLDDFNCVFFCFS